jgi:hypothetical protein
MEVEMKNTVRKDFIYNKKRKKYGYEDKTLHLQSSCWERKRKAETSANVQPPRKNTNTTLGISFCDD